MRTGIFTHEARAGYALLMVMGITGVALLTLAATLGRTLTNVKTNNRSNEYNVAGNAAQAAVEKIVARMGYDFQNYGPGAVYRNLSLYQASIPDEDPYWNGFTFSDGNGGANRTYVGMPTNNYSTLSHQRAQRRIVNRQHKRPRCP
jgi:hypothetical protein